nr:secretin and TonB N-terminal domain-containing protein [candidate division Zixibacteria bacterium]
MKYALFSVTIVYWLAMALAVAGPLDSKEKISLQFEDVPITTVLNMIAQQYNLNLVQSGEINENISVKLENVNLEDALNAILASNGYNFYFSGDIIVIKPVTMDAVGETEIKIIELKYISPASAVKAAEDLLSPKGKIRIIEGGTQTTTSIGSPIPTKLAVVDLAGVTERVAAFIAQLDRPEPLIAIEVRMVEINMDQSDQVGFKWPTSLKGRAHGVYLESESSDGSSSSSEAVGQIALPDGKWEWGKLSVGELSLVLDFLQNSGHSKLISDPRITTINNHQAEIKATTVVPIQTINRFSEGGSVQDIVTFQDEEIGITLLVTPHIADDNEIILDVQPTVAEIIGYSGSADNQKPITSERSVRTKIAVRDGETAVLGGLLKENKIETEQKLFFLGSLPILGNLFKHRLVETSTTDLMIMITPKISGN